MTLCCKTQSQVGRLPQGEHPLWGSVYLRWWLGRHLKAMYDQCLHATYGTPIHNFILRMLGAKIGKNVTLNTPHIYDPEWITLEVGLVGLHATRECSVDNAPARLPHRSRFHAMRHHSI